MLARTRFRLFAALVTFASIFLNFAAASAAGKAFPRAGLAGAAIKLEARIKAKLKRDAGQPTHGLHRFGKPA
jgi:hypothetical protein